LLPATWKGCKIVEDTWSGYKDATITVERGPAIRIINPRLKESHQFEIKLSRANRGCTHNELSRLNGLPLLVSEDQDEYEVRVRGTSPDDQS
jgi:hypothetical protein